MNERQTVEGSKRAFLKSFQHVIPPLYRRVIDELVVELNLISNQKDFQQNALFSIGLNEVFTTLTQGYQPVEHLPTLFDALCRSTSFDSVRVKSQVQKIQIENKPKTIDDIKTLLNGESKQINSVKHYSRLMAIGLYQLVMETELFPERQMVINESLKLSEGIGLPYSRVEKDLSLYNSTIERFEQAIELMKETALTEKKKRGISK